MIELGSTGLWQPAPASSVGARYTAAAEVTLPILYEHVRGWDVVVQAGCHIGVWPRLLCERFAKVLTFEADHDNLECARRNLDGYDNIVLTEAALSDCEGMVGWEHSTSNTGKHRPSPDGKGELVKAVTIDSLDLYALDALALDIEGHELFALKGAARTIERFSPAVLFEDNGRCRRYGVASDGVQQWLSQRGYAEVARVFDDRIWSRT